MDKAPRPKAADLEAEEVPLRVSRATPVGTASSGSKNADEKKNARGELAFKAPKTKRGRRSIKINDPLIELLLRVQDKQPRIVAGVPDGVTVAPVVKLPHDALISPAPRVPAI